MPTVVQIGAGSIGRGFLGQLWCEAGYETVFVDVSPALVAEINRRGSYPLDLIGTTHTETRTISPCRAVLASDTDSVVAELARCAFAATAVGVRHIESVARSLVTPAIADRAEPLNVLLCENGLTIRDDFRRGLDEHAEQVGAAETVIARMVPAATGNDSDPLAVAAEPYYKLPFNRSQWLGDAPDVPGLIAVPGSQFPAYELHKLYLHNGGHALLAYHGYRRGYEYLWQCAEDREIVAELRAFWNEIITAFGRSAYHAIPLCTPESLAASADDLLHRFRNRHLGDTVARVARDPARKLAVNDRLVGAALFDLQHGVEPIYAIRAIAAALCYRDSIEPNTAVSLPSALSRSVEKAYRALAPN